MKRHLLALLGISAFAEPAFSAAPVVTNVTALQITYTNATTLLIETGKQVRITYDLFDDDGDLLKVRVEISSTGGSIYSVPAFTFTGDIGANISTGVNRTILWDAEADWDGEYSTNMIVKVFATDNKGYPGLEWGLEVPASGFLMGQDGGTEGSGPSRHVTIPWSYWLSRFEITVAQYCDFLNMAYAVGFVTRRGTSEAIGQPLALPGFPEDPVPLLFLGDSLDIRWNVNNFEPQPGRSNFPAKVTWYGAMAFAQFYGYDLPTDAEWEKAARGPDHDDEDQHLRYPWGDIITSSDANFLLWNTNYLGPTPVGYFTNGANTYCLFDMAGNMAEWCRSTEAESVEDYPSVESINHPLHNINITTSRVLRGGSFDNNPLVAEDDATTVLDNGWLENYRRISTDPSNYVFAADYAAFSPPLFIGAAGFRVIRRDLPVNQQTIVFDPIETQNATSVLQLVASSSSGLPVKFQVISGPASLLNSNTISFSDAGSISILATQPGNDLFQPAEPVIRSFEVVRATAVINLYNLIQFYDGLPKPVAATTEPPGLPVSITYNGSLEAPSAMGSYAVTGKVNTVQITGVATSTLLIVSPILIESFDSTNWISSRIGSWTNISPSGRWTGSPSTFRFRNSTLAFSSDGCIGFTNINSRLFSPGLGQIPTTASLQARAVSTNVTGWVEFYQVNGPTLTPLGNRINVAGTDYRRIDARLIGASTTNIMIYGYRIYIDDVNIYK